MSDALCAMFYELWLGNVVTWNDVIKIIMFNFNDKMHIINIINSNEIVCLHHSFIENNGKKVHIV